MKGEKLTQAEIDRRMVQWHNDRRLEPMRRKRMAELEERCSTLEAENAELKRTIQKLLLRIEQLETMVFGRTRDRRDGDGDRGEGAAPPKERQPRPPSSFRRATPGPEEITDRTHHPLPACPDCGHALRRRRMITRFTEDIPLPKKTVTEQTIEWGFCPFCKKTQSAIPVCPQHCTLGPNVRLYVLFAVTVLGQTFEKVKAHLHGLHRLTVSDGELAAIIREGHRTLLPALQTIEAKIRDAPAAHYDETSYPVQRGEQGNFAWVKTSATGPETVFRLGRTRGKGNAEELRGTSSVQVAVTDDYAAYDNLFRHHALCWAHPLRKFRDLARSAALAPEHRAHCQRFYERFCILERSVALTIAAPLTPRERGSAVCRFRRRIRELLGPDRADPPALATVKKSFLDNREHYLLCIRIPGVPMTNNKAERSLRHLVIKRLLSFGSRSQRGAQAMETILSVCLTLWWRKPEDYFGELRSLMAA